jgi:hypothetical protein
MSKIDLSKANVGDKFRTRDGFIMTYYGYVNYKGIDYYLLKGEDCYGLYYNKTGKFILDRDTEYDLVNPALDKQIDELIKEATKHIKENDDAIAEENELQRRQEVLKYADRLFFNQKDTRIELFGYDVAIETAEIIVKSRDKYLKDGKLC